MAKKADNTKGSSVHRAYSPREVMERKRYPIQWGERWSGPFGHPEINEMWFVSGASASGKSSFVMQLAYELCSHGNVLYLSYEEGLRQSFGERIKRFHMGEVRAHFRVVINDTIEDLIERLSRPRSPRFVIVDSFQVSEWTYEQACELKERFPKKGFIFISQEHKGQPMGKPAARLRYIAGVKVRVVGYKAFCLGRFTGDPGGYFVVWEEGIMRTSNNL